MLLEESKMYLLSDSDQVFVVVEKSWHDHFIFNGEIIERVKQFGDVYEGG